MLVDPIIELHSRRCRCHGYLLQVRLPWIVAARARCGPHDDLPPGAIALAASHWIALGMPRTAEGALEASGSGRSDGSRARARTRALSRATF